MGIRLCPPAMPDIVASSHLGTSLCLHDGSDGFGPGFSSFALGTPRLHLPALVLHLRRQPCARRHHSAPLGLVGSSPCGSMLGSPPAGPALLPSSLLPPLPLLLVPAAPLGLCWCSVPGMGPAPTAARADRGSSLCSALLPLRRFPPTTASAPALLALHPPTPSCACARAAGGVLVTQGGLWASFRGGCALVA